MQFDFDETISRAGTASIAGDGYEDFLLGHVPPAERPEPGVDLLTMWVADMEFASAPMAIEAIRDRLDRRILGYTLDADDDYRSVFADWCDRRYGWRFDADHLRIGNGIVPAIIDLIDAACGPGEKVLTLTPAYHWFEEAADRLDVELVTCALTTVEGRTMVDLDRFESLVADPAVVLFLLCHPHNPSGRAWNEEELGAMADRCRAHGVRIVSDEVHADLLRSGRRHTPLDALVPASDGITTCLAPSKTFNLAGMMFSNIIIGDDDLRERFDRRHLGVTNPLSLAAATAVYRDGDGWLDALRGYLDDNLALVGSILAERLPGARFEVPEATYLAWIDLGSHADGIEDLTGFFAREARVLLEGPENFVADAEGCVRLNVACPRVKVETAVHRMADALTARAG